MSESPVEGKGNESKKSAINPVICAHCNNSIEGSWCKALGKTWHPEHFLCTLCKKPFRGGTFTVKDNKPYCEEDYLHLFGVRCKKCTAIIENTSIVALDSHWHPEHFTCVSCNKILNVQEFYEEGSKPYCPDCYKKMFCPLCTKCQKPITENFLTALKSKWHTYCFKCFKCLLPIKGVFTVQDGNFYCDNCTKAYMDAAQSAKQNQ